MYCDILWWNSACHLKLMMYLLSLISDVQMGCIGEDLLFYHMVLSFLWNSFKRHLAKVAVELQVDLLVHLLEGT